MSNTPITAELREFADEIYERAGYGAPYGPSGENEELSAIADRIDAEHETRMSQSRQSSRLAAIRYIRGVLLDYERGVKRVRKGDKVEVVRCRDCSYCQRHVDGSHVCELTHLAHRGDYYCYFGARREVDE